MFSFLETSTGIELFNGKESQMIDFAFQPIYDPKSRKIFYYEVLSRFPDCNIRNDEFFFNADDRFIFDLTISQLNFVRNNNFSVPVSVNINLSLLLDDNFINTILMYSDMKFILEVSKLNADLEKENLHKNISILKQYDIQIWLDDFHHEHEKATLSLGVIDWDRIKIDQSFLYHNCLDDESIKALDYVLSPFAKFGLIFEGVETSIQNNLIKRSSALAQGYYFAYPEFIGDANNRSES